MQQAGDGSDTGSTDGSTDTQQMQQGSVGQPGAAPNGRTARQALNELSNNAAAASERQRAGSQLEASRNALERSLGHGRRRVTGAGHTGVSP